MGLQQQRVLGLRLVAHVAFQRRHGGFEPLQRAFVGGARGNVFGGTHRRHQPDFVAHRIEHGHQRRAHQQRVGGSDRVGFRRRQPLHLAHHVVAEIAEHARRHRRQAGNRGNGRFVEQGAQGFQRRLRAGGKGVAVAQGVAVDLRLAAGDAEDHVGIEADHRITATRGAAFDGFQQENVAPARPPTASETPKPGFPDRPPVSG